MTKMTCNTRTIRGGPIYFISYIGTWQINNDGEIKEYMKIEHSLESGLDAREGCTARDTPIG